ncbi:MAG: transposase, partial [Hydrogenobaculum sp.]
MYTYAVNAANSTNNINSAGALQNQISALVQSIKQIVNTTTFNGKKLLNGNFINQAIQFGGQAGQYINISIDNLSIERMGGPKTNLCKLRNFMFKYFKRRFYIWQEAFLEDNPEDYRNGFYFRTLSTKIGKLNLEIPQVYHGLGQKYYKELVDKVREINPSYTKYLEKYKSNYLAFLKYPEPVKKYIYTTNIVESVNSGLEFMRNKQGFRGRLVGFFNSLKTLEINAFIQFA